jgi:cytochrome c1
VEWLSAFIRDPKSKKDDARMPPFPAEKISDADLQALAEYLASLKGDQKAEDKPVEKPAE